MIAGEHEIEVSVNGTTFKRQYRKQIIIHDEPATANIEFLENGSLKVSILPYQTIIDVDSMQVTAIHKSPNGDKNTAKVKNINPAEWAHEFPTKEITGKHKVTINISGHTKSGKSIKSTLRPLTPVIDSKTPPDIENEATSDEDSVNDNTFSWAMVSLKIGIFNLFFISFIFFISPILDF